MPLIFIYKRTNMSGISLFWDYTRDITRLAQLLKNNNACIGSSDTVIGILAPLTLQGYLKLNILKERSQKPYVVLVGSFDRVERFAYFPKVSYLQKLLKSCWPGPLTVILQSKHDNEKFLQFENNTIAIRVPDHVGLRKLLQYIDGVFSTSANKAGKPIPALLDDVDANIQRAVECTITERIPKKSLVSSTIIDCSQEKLTLIREGAISFAYLTKMVENFKEK